MGWSIYTQGAVLIMIPKIVSDEELWPGKDKELGCHLRQHLTLAEAMSV